MKVAAHLRRSSWAIFATVALLQSTSAQTARQGDLAQFRKQFIDAFTRSYGELMDSLIKRNRLFVKPFVDDQLALGMNAELQGRATEAQPAYIVSTEVARRFQALFGEKSLVMAVEYVKNWTTENKRKKLTADSLYDLGTRLRGSAQTRDQALEVYQKALDFYRSIGDRRGEGTTLGGIGFVYWFKRDTEKMLSFFQNALDRRIEVDDKQLVGNSYSDIGSVYWNFLKDYPRALFYHMRAESVRAEIGDLVGQGKSLNNIALAYWDMGEFKNALENYRRSTIVHGELGDESSVASARYNMGILSTRLGNYPDALQPLSQAKQIREKLAEKDKLALVLNQLGIVYRRLGEYETALDTHQAMLALLEETKDEKAMESALHSFGVLLRTLGRTEKAGEYFQRALEISRKRGNKSGVQLALGSLGLVYFDQREYAKSGEYLREALALSRSENDRATEISNLINLGNALLYGGQREEALKNYEAALEGALRLNAPELIWPALLGLGEYNERSNNPEKAIYYYDRALESLEGMRGKLQDEEFRAAFLANKRFAYEAVIHFLSLLHQKNHSRRYDEKAFELAERAKARVFLDQLTEALANVREGVDPALLEKERAILAELNAAQQQLQRESSRQQVNEHQIGLLKKQINDQEMELRSLQKEIRARNPRYSDLHYPQTITLKETQALLPDDQTVLLEYSVGDSSTTLWAVTKKARSLYLLPNRQSIQEQMEILQYGLLNPANTKPELFAKAGYRLYHMLVQPARSLIKRNARLIFIPDGILHYLPFSVLVTKDVGKRNSGSFAELPFLVKSNHVSYAQSASVLRSLITERKKKERPPKGLIAFGDPVFGKEEQSSVTGTKDSRLSSSGTPFEGLQRLKFSGEEVTNIAKLLSSSQARVYLREEATEERAKENELLNQYRYVHFATHGLVNERKPDFSGIVLTRTDASKEDGYLQAFEIFNLKLNADLVTLSACQSGLGRFVQGEGIVGLTRAFMYAGAHSVLVSLWSVSDVSTARLMEEFYKNVFVAKQGKSQSLRAAQLALLKTKQFTHPFYWAPFVLVGDWE